MTREESIKEITNHLNHWKRLKEEKICSEADGENAINAFEMAINALKQQPCEDAISRQAVLELHQLRLGAREIYKAIYDLPPVTQQSKMGQWIKQEDGTYKCSNCKKYELWEGIYCASCGAKMGGAGE